MRLRPFIENKDFDEIKNWISDERTHAMWCANLIHYPMEKENFHDVMAEIAEKFNDCPYIATTDDGKPVGFFCYSANLSTNEGMFKFVMVSPEYRGKGFAREMLTLALKYAFDITKVEAVTLNVFPENIKAKKCYESIGFVERKTDSGAFKFNNELWGRCNMVICSAKKQ